MRGLLRNLGVGLYCDSSSYEAEETAVSSVAPPQTVSSSGCQQGEPIAQAWVTLSRLCNLENCGEESKPQAWGLSHIQTDACTWDNTEKFVQKDITHTSPQSDAQTHTYRHTDVIYMKQNFSLLPSLRHISFFQILLFICLFFNLYIYFLH